MTHTDIDFDPELDYLDRLSNGVLDLIEAGRLDDAQRACEELKTRFPDQMDWMERTAALHEARGEIVQAIAHYDLCIAYIRKYRDDFDPDSEEWYREKIALLRVAL
jgi:hypothetical protein